MEMRRFLVCSLLLVLTTLPGFSQRDIHASLTIQGGRMFISIPKNIEKQNLETFVKKYDLSDLNLIQALFSGRINQLSSNGWHIDVNDNRLFEISKVIDGVSQLNDPEKRMALTEDHPNNYDLFPPRNDNIVFGFNRFVGKPPFGVHDSLVTFYLRGYGNAREVLLAASFTNWQHGALRMTHTDSGWISVVRLGPGKYWYKFIADGNWMIDPDNSHGEYDPSGNLNSVYYKPNVTFNLPGHPDSKNVLLTGSFNSWNRGGVPMQRNRSGWTIQLYLAEGTYAYKFLVDGKWIEDPSNANRTADGHNGFNSIFRLGSPHLFTLKGHPDAKSVVLTGTFNGWRTYECYMHKTAGGWELPYTLGPGNYQYRFIVDGKWIDDPDNPLFVYNRNQHVANAFLIIQPNYTFRLNGYPDAKAVFLAGDFNDWTPNGLKMSRVGNSWVFNVHLSTGKHLYKFIVDGHWIKDPDNPLWEENEYNSANSVLWMVEK
jgi:hypothetical protein